jgi:hypothetical protein
MGVVRKHPLILRRASFWATCRTEMSPFTCAFEWVPGRYPIRQRRDEDRVVQAAPGCEAEAANGVPKEGQAFEGGPCTSGHDFDVRLPSEFGVDEEPEVADLL